MGADREAFEAVQPNESRQGLVLLTRAGEAAVETADGARTPIRLRKRERLATLAEVRGGWAAAGTRDRAVGSELVVMQEGISGRLRTPLPAGEARLRIAPLLLVDRGDLVGLAWLEGDGYRGLAVRVADWTGVDWGPVRTVSPPGVGSQTGLTGAVLDDGSILLAWSRFDGEDDEIYWSLSRGGEFTEARRLGADNRVPDVAPTLIASGRGARLAWSRIEGDDYRVMTATFDSGRWTPVRASGEPGSIFPSFHRTEEGLFLVYRNAYPRGWTVGELGDSGRVTRRARQRTEESRRPVVSDANDADVAMSWPSASAEIRARWEASP